MFSYYFQGLALGAAMILPLGPQNAFVMNQGIRRQYHIMIALLCAISDLVLICAGIFGPDLCGDFWWQRVIDAVAVVAGAGHLGRRSLLAVVWFWRF